MLSSNITTTLNVLSKQMPAMSHPNSIYQRNRQRLRPNSRKRIPFTGSFARCEICGSKENLHRHRAIESFGYSRANVSVLCAMCHARFHRLVMLSGGVYRQDTTRIYHARPNARLVRQIMADRVRPIGEVGAGGVCLGRPPARGESSGHQEILCAKKGLWRV